MRAYLPRLSQRYSFQELDNTASLVGIPAFLSELRWLILQYCDTVDYVGSLSCQYSLIHARLGYYQRTCEVTEMCQSPLAA